MIRRRDSDATMCPMPFANIRTATGYAITSAKRLPRKAKNDKANATRMPRHSPASPHSERKGWQRQEGNALANRLEPPDYTRTKSRLGLHRSHARSTRGITRPMQSQIAMAVG